ncbi:divergent polysaccharide deacetylase family protein [Falsigemmobacter faecalis]|uniref:Divergent polysaccharide deacetylase family protein n=1 Tax=Falsigemmobacter faecalis TaxID=2488730 RepID=A0A3P3DQV8_9RHOB|nr:divergent polysaccharide deacetylase family protein [Falsigemmobacter faecalis]RRH76324.1 hypothetical protein EG244_06080 [Falsigemmobacter faecalis]
MPRGFLAGVVGGGVAGALGLAGISLILPPPKTAAQAPVAELSAPSVKADEVPGGVASEGLPAATAEGSIADPALPAQSSGAEPSGDGTSSEIRLPDAGSSAPSEAAPPAEAPMTAAPAEPELPPPAAGEAALPAPAALLPPASPAAPAAAAAPFEPDAAAEIAAAPERPSQPDLPSSPATGDAQSGTAPAAPSPELSALTPSEAAGPADENAEAGARFGGGDVDEAPFADSGEASGAGTVPADSDAAAGAGLPDGEAGTQAAPFDGDAASEGAQTETAQPGRGEATALPPPEHHAPAQVASPGNDIPGDSHPTLDTPETPASEAQAVPARPRILQPAPALSGAAEGVTRHRLPSIGSAPAEIIDETAPAGDALRRHARSFANPSGRPPFAVLLLDEGSVATEDLAQIASSNLPLTLVVDPATPEAAVRAALWRAAGQEVALLAEGIMAGAKGSDGEIAVEAMVSAVPEALALVAPPGESALQSDRMAAAAVVTALAARGFGLVTWDQGLNAADQVARREGLAAVTIYRDLNGRDDSGPVITRALDRAAFKAQQDGRAVVFGRLEPATIEALMSWSLSARAASLTPAPLSAVLK